jgi:hypothetical protein
VRFAGLDVTRDVSVVLGAIGLVHEHSHVLAEHVRGAIAEHALGRAIESDDYPDGVDNDDRIDRRIEQGLKLRGDHCGVLSSVCGCSSHT